MLLNLEILILAVVSLFLRLVYWFLSILFKIPNYIVIDCCWIWRDFGDEFGDDIQLLAKFFLCLFLLLISLFLFYSSRFPILYRQISGGRILALMFFFSLAMAGFSSLVAQIEMLVHNVVDLGGKNHIRHCHSCATVCSVVWVIGNV